MTRQPRKNKRPSLPAEKPAAGTKRGVGRPKVQVTDDLRRQVEELVSVGMEQAHIALAIGVSDKWLRQRLRESLDNGGARRRAEIVALAFKAARSGNVAAIKHLDMQTAAAAATATITATEASTRRLGKKEQQREDALAAGDDTDWGTDLVTGREQDQRTAH